MQERGMSQHVPMQKYPQDILICFQKFTHFTNVFNRVVWDCQSFMNEFAIFLFDLISVKMIEGSRVQSQLRRMKCDLR